jgi:hypothetical protein
MPQVGFQPTIPMFERAKAVYALDRAATVINMRNLLNFENLPIDLTLSGPVC